MGQCYSVNSKLKYKDLELVRVATVKFINDYECEWHKTKEEISSSSFEDLLDMFLYIKRENDLNYKALKNGTYELKLTSNFDQSYGWEELILDWFFSVEDVLLNGSYFTVYPDEDYDRLVIKNNKCVQTH